MKRLVISATILSLFIFQLSAISGERAIEATGRTQFVVETKFDPNALYPIDDCINQSAIAREKAKKEDAQPGVFMIKTATIKRMERKLTSLTMVDSASFQKALPSVDYLCTNYQKFLDYALDEKTIEIFRRTKAMFDANLDRIGGILRVARITERAEEKINTIGDKDSKRVKKIAERTNNRIDNVSTKDVDYYIAAEILDTIERRVRSVKKDLSLFENSREELDESIDNLNGRIFKIRAEVELDEALKKTELSKDVEDLKTEIKKIQTEYADNLAFLATLSWVTPEEIIDLTLNKKDSEYVGDDIIAASERFTALANKVRAIRAKIEILPAQYDGVFERKAYFLKLWKDVLEGWEEGVEKKIVRDTARIESLNEKITYLKGLLDVNDENLSAVYEIDWNRNEADGSVTYKD